MKVTDQTVAKVVKVHEVRAGFAFKTTNLRENGVYIKVDPFSLEEPLKKLGEGRLVMRVADGKLFLLANETLCYEVDSLLILESISQPANLEELIVRKII